ncbi:MAG: S8 family serine peptidase, partial [Planctomycetota bacterium]
MTQLRLPLAAGLAAFLTAMVTAGAIEKAPSKTSASASTPASIGTPVSGVEAILNQADPVVYPEMFEWTGEAIDGPRRKLKGRKFPTESLVEPIDPRTGESVATGRVVVKFSDDLGIQGSANPVPFPVSMNGSDIAAVEQIMVQSGSTMQRWINRTPEQLAALTARAEAHSGRPQPDLASIVYIDPPRGELVNVAQALNELDVVDWVVIDRKVQTMQQGCDPTNEVLCNGANANCDCVVVTVRDTPLCANLNPQDLTCDDECAAVTLTGYVWNGDALQPAGCNPDPGGDDPIYGCADVNCCNLVSNILPACADPDSAQGWDSYCAAIANLYCFGTIYDSNNPNLADRYDPCLRDDENGGPDPAFAAFLPVVAGGCFEAHTFGGCNQPDCCNSVCLLDPTCCTTEWDSFCVTLAFQNDVDCSGPGTEADTPDYAVQVAQVQEETIFGQTITAERARGRQAYTAIQPVLGAIGAIPSPGTPGLEFLQTGYRGGGFDLAGLRDLSQQFSNEYQGGADPIVNGRTINVAVIEFGAFVNHEDFVLATPSNADGTGGTPLDQPKVIGEPGQTIILLPSADTEPDHGTACLGEIVAADNGFGVTGIAHEAQGWFFPIVSLEEGPRLPTAITSAIETFEAGDVMSFSIGPAGGPFCGDGTHPTLVSDPGIWTLIRLGTDLGILSCIAAGNSSADVEAEGGEIRSGALIVGACWPGQQLVAVNPGGAYCRLPFSCWTSGEEPLAQVDVAAWGTAITTTGYGALFDGKTAPDTPNLEVNRLRDYTAGFNGTSGATPMIAGIAACVQGWSKQIYGLALAPEVIGGLMRENGFQQCSIQYGSPNFPGNDECPAAGDVIVGDGAETRHRVGPFPEVVSVAAGALTSVPWPSIVDNYRIRTGTELTEFSRFRLSAPDGIAIEIATERGRAGQQVAGLVYLTGGWMTDIEVVGTYDGNLDELAGLQVANRASGGQPRRRQRGQRGPIRLRVEPSQSSLRVHGRRRDAAGVSDRRGRPGRVRAESILRAGGFRGPGDRRGDRADLHRGPWRHAEPHRLPRLHPDRREPLQ